MILDIHPDRCTGCRSCVLYCSLAHEKWIVPELARISILSSRTRRIITPVVCIPCDAKPCMAACPEPGAMHLDEHGAVVIEESLCVACGRCARACAIGAIRIHSLPGRGKKGKAVALKCDLCSGDPWCAKVCPSGAITVIHESASSAESFERILEARKNLEGKA